MTGQQSLHLLGDNVSDGYEPTVALQRTSSVMKLQSIQQRVNPWMKTVLLSLQVTMKQLLWTE